MASERLGASFSIDTTNLKAGLKQANSLIRESESEFKKAAAGMEDWTKSEDGLNAKIKSLTQVTNVQKEKVNALKTEYNKLIDEGLDPTSKQAVDLRTKINKEEAALKSNEKELENQKSALSNLGNESEQAGKKVDKLGSVAKGVGKVAAAAFAAAAAAVVALGKSAIESYAEYEQLVGGVETLFKSSSDEVQKYAANAYKTAGLSANEYMEQATSFSAALIQSLGGDTSKAAAEADKAITDMSDNANKMGTDIESLQNAYGGFAKGNFTMLDNLKLGYGGTKTEMERLLADASKISGIKYDVSSYADIVDAIHVVQDEMGITGTTAKEASETIQGSIGMMKGAWQNLIAGLGNEDADFDALITNLIDSVMTVLQNLLPRVQVVVQGLINMVGQLLPQIPKIISDMLPQVVDGVVGLMQGLMQALPQVVQAIADVVPQILTALMNMMPTFLEGLMQILISILDAITQSIPQIVDTFIQVVPQMVTALVGAVPQLIQGAIQLLMALIQAIPVVISALIDQIPTIVDAIITTLIDSLPVLIDGAVQLFMALIDAIPIIIGKLVTELPTIITSIVSSLIKNAPKILKAGVQIFLGLVKAIPKVVVSLVKAIPTLIKTIVDGLGKGIGQVAEVGLNLVKGLWQGIKDAAGWVLDKIKGFGQSILDGIKDFFGIHSPSTLIEDEVGLFVGQAVGTGMMKSLNHVMKNVKSFGSQITDGLADSIDTNIDGLNDNLSMNIDGTGRKQGVTVYQTNNYSQAHSRYELYKSRQQTAAAVRLAMKGV